MINLRERRRIEMAREIQLSTLELIKRDGFDSVTTEAISRHLGISQRTFFNYYANKEAALMGETPTIPKEAIEVFLTGSDNFYVSLYKLMLANTLSLTARRNELLIVHELMDSYPKLSQIRLAGMTTLRDELSSVLTQKLPTYSSLVLVILSDMLLSSAWSGIELWLRDSIDLDKAFDQSWSALMEASNLLIPS